MYTGCKVGTYDFALAEHANLKRRVWIDVFTVRRGGNDADLNLQVSSRDARRFSCLCFLNSFTNMARNQAMNKDISKIPDQDRKRVRSTEFGVLWKLLRHVK